MGRSASSIAEHTDSAAKPPATARPFLKWAGGKTRLLPELLKRVPKEFGRYHEPFAGGAALFFELQQSAPFLSAAFLSDINPELINVYQTVKGDVEVLISDLETHRHDPEYFYKVRNADRDPEFAGWSSVRRASRFIYLNKTCFNGLYRVNSRGHFNVPFGEYSNPKIADTGNLRACSSALEKAELSLSAFDAIIENARRGDFVYFDPPYAPLSKTAHFTGYSKGGFGEDLQISLSRVCAELDHGGVKFLLSNSSTEAILNLYKEFRVEIVQAPRAINSKGEKRGLVPEILVRNY